MDPFMRKTLRMVCKMLKNAGYVPREIQDQREIRCRIECPGQKTNESRKMRQIQKVQLVIARAKIEHGELLQEENKKYFQKVVACVTLNKIRVP
jgi:hypothetical protein